MLWDIAISKSLDRYLQRGRVTGARNTQITISVTLTVTLANRFIVTYRFYVFLDEAPVNRQ